MKAEMPYAGVELWRQQTSARHTGKWMLHDRQLQGHFSQGLDWNHELK